MIMLPALLLLVGGAIYWFTHRQPRLRGELVALPDHRDGTTAPVGTPSPPASGGVRIEVGGLAKRFGHVPAVDSVSFSVEPGRVTAFLGPNGAGKTTTLRMLLGLAAPTAGAATIGGLRYDELDRPVRSVGAVLEGGAAHRGRTGRNHLRIICRAGGVPLERADEVLALVGLAAACRRPFRTYSLGMRQRLGIAAALIGNPQVLILDEPANGLDPEGIRWLRVLCAAWPIRAARCWSPATCSARWPRPRITWW